MPLGSGVRKPWGSREYVMLLSLVLSKMKISKFEFGVASSIAAKYPGYGTLHRS